MSEVEKDRPLNLLPTFPSQSPARVLLPGVVGVNRLSYIQFRSSYSSVDFPGNSDSKASAYNAGDAGDTGLIPGLGRYLEKEMATHSSILA